MGERQRMTRERRREQVERCLAADMTVKGFRRHHHRKPRRLPHAHRGGQKAWLLRPAQRDDAQDILLRQHRRARGQRHGDHREWLDGSRLPRAELRGCLRPRPHDAYAPARLCRFDWRRAIEDNRRPSKTSEEALSETESAIIVFLRVAGPSRTSEVAVGIDKSTARTNVLLRRLAEQGLVSVSGATSARRYRLAE